MISSGETHSVREFCELAFSNVGLDYQDYVKVDERFYRPAEVNLLVGDSSKAHRVLNWQPQHTFQSLVKEMVENDLHSPSREEAFKVKIACSGIFLYIKFAIFNPQITRKIKSDAAFDFNIGSRFFIS